MLHPVSTLAQSRFASDIERIVAFLRDGDDRYHGGGSDGGRDRGINIRQLIFGGDDDDNLSGGRWMDAIFGGDGDDKIDGHGDADILVGGAGKDRIKGRQGKDLLVGGIVDNSFKDSSILEDIDAAMFEWATGQLDNTLLLVGPIIDDGDRDQLFGEKDDDELFRGVGDRLKR